MENHTNLGQRYFSTRQLGPGKINPPHFYIGVALRSTQLTRVATWDTETTDSSTTRLPTVPTTRMLLAALSEYASLEESHGSAIPSVLLSPPQLIIHQITVYPDCTGRTERV